MENNRTATKPALEISLALSGGAARGTFHLGFIQALQENGVIIKVISGTSAGAIVGGAIACGLSPAYVFKLLQSKEFRDIFKFNWFRKSIFSIDHNAQIIKKLFPLQNINKTPIPFYTCITDIKAHKTIFANEGNPQKLITASCLLIPIFAPMTYEDKVLADGGILNLLPTQPLLKYGYPILGINLVPTQPPKKYNFYTSTKRAWQLLLNTTLPNDMKNCEWYIAPEELKSLKLFSLSDLDKGFDLGYEKGLEWCEAEL